MRWTPAACCARPSAPTIRFCFSSTSASIASRTIARSIPGPDFTIPFGRARTVKTGRSLTIVTYGAVVQKALQAAMQVERGNPDASIEVIDLRSLSPYDWDAIRASVEKTNRVLVAHEDTLSWGYGAEIAARIADELFDRLDAPVRRVGALDTWVGYHPQLENAILPQVDDLAREVERLLAY